MLLEIIDADQHTVPAPRLPTVIELCAAFTGRVPNPHPARAILLAAAMLTTAHDWVNPDEIVIGDQTYNGNGIDYDRTGSEALGEIGITDISEPVRAALVDRIDNAAADGGYPYRIGYAIDAIARAHGEYRRAASALETHTTNPRITQWNTRARRHIVATQRHYRILANQRTWTEGPNPEPPDPEPAS
ncbi:hypothetical protein [Nocardia puris]|uniref:hypothetical protein n=1 Tax=Nocardia puris TaxID=208602 RepID=UPI0018DEA388|nr:hypothetical protein [Nocardia puris]